MTWIWQHHPEAGRAGALVLSRRVVQFEIQKEGIKEEAVAGTFVYFLPAVMTDPFVQRMMARSHARRAAVAQTLGNKENVSMSDSTRSRLKHLSALHSGNSSEALSPLQPSVDNIEPPRTASLPKKSDFSPDRKLRKEPGDMEMHQPVKIGENQGPTSPHKPRLTSLAKRCQEINNWDDDYSYHSSSHGSQVAVGGNSASPKKFDVHGAYSLSASNPGKIKPLEVEELTKNTNVLQSPSRSSSTSSYGSVGSGGESSLSSYASLSPATKAPSSPHVAQHPKLQSNLQTPNKTELSQNANASPTKKLLWDRGLLNSLINLNDGLQEALEAQGFTPTDSRSKLYYDFKKDQQKNANEESPSKTFSTTRIPSPPASPSKGRGRDVSPSKVGEMRSRWEQHIRQASPERTDRSRSPRKTESPKKVPSPKKNQQVTSTSNTEIPSQSASVNHESPSKSPEKYNQSGFKRFTSERKSWREVSPHKPGPIGEVVKGEAPMPQAVPLVDQPFSSSVRERAAAFDSAKKQEPQKDPAEMSVQERLAIFSKKQGGALVPKAPFGQPVPAKALQSGSVGSQEAAIHSSVAHSQPVQRPSKRMASEAASTFEHHGSVSQKNDKHMSPDKKRITNFEQQRKAFEYIEDSWQDNDISSKVRAERQQEMEVLLNRFKKPKQMPKSNNIENRHQSLNEKPRYPVESESEYLESDESIGESSTSEDSSQDNMPGPPKPPRLYKDVIPEAPPLQDAVARRTQLSPLKVHQSPKKEFIPKMKPGCIYPSLSDIESHSEAPDSQDEDVKDSSFAESVLTCTSMESLGQKIQKVANTGSRRPLSMIEESTYSQTRVNSSMSESTMEALDAIDDAIDEALDDDLSPTPPKRQCSRDNMNVYKTPKINDTPPSHNTEEQDVTLAHSISMYRKQKPDVICTPVRQIIRRPDLHSPSPEPVSPSVTVSARIKELQEEVLEQQRVIAQASNAVSVVLKRPEQQGTPQHVEAEKLLLLSSQKRQSALNEIQRIKAEGALGQQSWAGDDTCMGSISISNITVPLKHEFLQRGMKGNDLYHLMVLVKHREQVISSQLMTTPECVVEGAVTFPNLIALHHLTSNFNITLEVYALSTQEPRQLNMKKEQSRMKLTPLKKLHKHESRTASPSIQSPGGPFAVRTSSFQLVGFTHLNMSTLTRNAWTLEMVPYSSSLDGHLLMHVNCSFEGGITERGFLTMFEDVGGYGAWNRRWCVLSGMHLRYWKYPDDETRKEASGKLDLRSCTTRRVELVSRDICARQHTFQLTLLRPAHPGEETNLVQEVKGSSVVTKMLLSADSKEERMVWCNKLNKALANIRAWDPDAMQPQDYQV
ncbi:anillin-like isoform X5 [Portunus trituberculatus]|uniref:anillin-like isoform X5 n=1 Tax=Portunus trituberculatus TaxID=210409 RepID=UPI001E1CD5CF|nr:anillin-like isoform X5 [Portunus trituberculatus]